MRTTVESNVVIRAPTDAGEGHPESERGVSGDPWVTHFRGKDDYARDICTFCGIYVHDRPGHIGGVVCRRSAYCHRNFHDQHRRVLGTPEYGSQPARRRAPELRMVEYRLDRHV